MDLAPRQHLEQISLWTVNGWNEFTIFKKNTILEAELYIEVIKTISSLFIFVFVFFFFFFWRDDFAHTKIHHKQKSANKTKIS